MQDFYGTKHIKAKPMTRGEYNEFRRWELPANENGADEGFLVEYQDGGKPNVEGYKGYVSWSPKEQFDNAYQGFDALSFGHAILAAQKGNKVARAGWNGKGMWLCLVPENHWGIDSSIQFDYEQIGNDLLPWIGMKTADNKFVPWLASQTDVLANDWQIVA